MCILYCIKCVIELFSACVVTTATACSRRMNELSREINNMQNVAFGRVECWYSPHSSSGFRLLKNEKKLQNILLKS